MMRKELAEALRKLRAQIRNESEYKDVWEALRRDYKRHLDSVIEDKRDEFQVGDRVWFRSSKIKNGGAPINGKITRLLPKNIEVEVMPGIRWRVSPMLLHLGEA